MQELGKEWFEVLQAMPQKDSSQKRNMARRFSDSGQSM
jgi:hypothetical protein